MSALFNALENARMAVRHEDFEMTRNHIEMIAAGKMQLTADMNAILAQKLLALADKTGEPI